MDKRTKIAIFVFIMLAILTVGFFIVKKEYVPTEVDNTLYEAVSDTTVVGDTNSIGDTNTVVYDEYIDDTVSYDVVSEESLYYVVVGSFKYEVNAHGLVGVVDQSDIVSNGSYHMVYIYKTDDIQDAINIKNTNEDKYKGVWIYKNNE